MIQAAIFDLDGTLADTMPDLSTAMNSMLRHFSLPERSNDELIQAINNGAREFVRGSLPQKYHADEDFVTKALEVYTEQYATCYAEKTCPYAGMIQVLENLQKSGLILGVLSNKQDSFVKEIIEKFFPTISFRFVEGQSDLPAKPNPASVLRMAKNMGVSPDQVLFVGDSHVDIQTARNAGMTSIGVTWGYRDETVLRENGAVHIVSDVPALQKLILSLR